MAERNVFRPGVRTPWLAPDGKTVSPVWHKFLMDLHERTGGAPLDKVDLSAGAAETAIDAAATAQTAADAAQELVDSIDDRLDFDFEFDLR